MSTELDKARAALAEAGDTDMDNMGHLRAALTEIDRLTAAMVEAEATIANERGEGEPPTPGWNYDAGEWVHPDATVSPVVVTALGGSVRRRWEWGTVDKAGQRDTARAAMRAATLKETP